MLAWFLMIGFGLALPVIIVGVVTIGFGVLTNYIVEAADKKAGQVISGDSQNSDGGAGVLVPWLRKTWQYLIERHPSDFKEYRFVTGY